jgi:hypothetical protein
MLPPKNRQGSSRLPAGSWGQYEKSSTQGSFAGGQPEYAGIASLFEF